MMSGPQAAASTSAREDRPASAREDTDLTSAREDTDLTSAREDRPDQCPGGHRPDDPHTALPPEVGKLLFHHPASP